jgi:superfamily II DNA/RNA helicase
MKAIKEMGFEKMTNIQRHVCLLSLAPYIPC